MIKTDTIKRGAKNGLNTVAELAKVIIPVYFIITILKHTQVLSYVASYFEPLMKVFGLPGEAAIVLVLGNVLNIYAAIGVIASLVLTAKQITIIAVMLSFSHALPIETAVSKKIGVSVIVVVSIRIGLAILSGLMMNLIL
ncbi:nucleoside recognition domain-containing protein [Maledivibacter halophilus]|uniref:Fe2+ transport system protein B n=1 Tax=Maledivibacter halophilus TaxID=36842 RepID=A0A1T5MU22_9FIRM|nr:nucleoside recognition domain-containing protein [Maledivibacter halophilus]SKC91399.1 Fe2+ transport system protein B [Maledivibacter halophilus]